MKAFLFTLMHAAIGGAAPAAATALAGGSFRAAGTAAAAGAIIGVAQACSTPPQKKAKKR